MKRILPLLFPLSVGAQSLQEMGFSKIEISDTLNAIIEKGEILDRDTSVVGNMLYLDSIDVYVNVLDRPKQIIYSILKGNHRVDIYLLFDGKQWYTKTEKDFILYNSKINNLYNILDYLPTKYKKI